MCALLALDINSRGLVDSSFKPNSWASFLNEDGFQSNMWLVAYEAPLKKWLTPSNDDYLRPDTLAGALYKRSISFYDVNKNVSRTKLGHVIKRFRLARSEHALALLRSLGLDQALDE